MTFVDGIRSDFNNKILQHGLPIRLRYFTVSGGSASYDDDVTLTASGADVWESGLVFPVQSEKGTSVALLLEQGKVLQTDQILYIKGTLDLSGQSIVIGTGSPTTNEYSLVPEGVTNWQINGSSLFQTTIIRRLTTGSLYSG